jgi:hypothetical protein
LNKLQATRILITALLIALPLGTVVVNVAWASEAWYYGGEINPPADAFPPTITVNMPKGTFNTTDNIPLNFSVYAVQYGSIVTFICEVGYRGDWMSNHAVYQDLKPQLQQGNLFYDPSGYQSAFSYASAIQGVPEGNHTITIYATERSFKVRYFGLIDSFQITSTLTVSFSVSTPPTPIPTIIAPTETSEPPTDTEIAPQFSIPTNLPIIITGIALVSGFTVAIGLSIYNRRKPTKTQQTQ